MVAGIYLVLFNHTDRLAKIEADNKTQGKELKELKHIQREQGKDIKDIKEIVTSMRGKMEWNLIYKF